MNEESSKQDELQRDFLAKAGWDGAKAHTLAGDASTRSYQRIEKDAKRAVLMIAPPHAEAAPCPKDASPEARRALGYNALARLAGPNLNAFTALSQSLRQADLSAPEIYAADADKGFAIIEDLGDDLYARVAGRIDEATLYQTAIDALLTLRTAAPKRPSNNHYAMLDYDQTAMLTETALLADWYWPLKKGVSLPPDLSAEYTAAWSGVLSSLSAPHAFALRDYHAENLLWLPQREGFQRAGVIDFQDALFGHAAYDLVSLLEDARRDVDPALAAAMIDYYLKGAVGLTAFDRDTFLQDYSILAAQRNAKILGIFARLAKREGKHRYLDLMPRVEAHFRNDLRRPGLELLSKYFAAHLPELEL